MRFFGSITTLALLTTAFLIATGAHAQEATPPASPEPRESESSDRGAISLRGSIGMTASPETFAMTLEMPVRATDLVSVGPLFQLGFADDHVMVGTTLQAYLTPRLEGEQERWQPYASVGMGVIYLEDDDRRPGRDDEDTDFLLTFGTGIDYRVSEEWSIGSAFLFNTIPGGAVGNRFIWGWQMLTLRYAF